ncbi:YncE family protein [Roseomonas populi]|uniref:YncE family protein n=1 Tax=Roseomonas populi TaxID=3121582 RepID=A0ABT1X5L0_9PROT|nr:YncE family protein [Roseomonas pecuniae]MCR0982249.1 YncE family protein [Roseomonas pecuniae]
MHRRTLILASLAAATAAPAAAQGKSGTLLVMEKNDARLAFLDASDGRRLGQVELPEFPHEFVVDPAGRHAFVGHYGVEASARPGEGGHSVLVVDIAARKVARRIDLSPFNRLHGMGVDAQGRLSVVSEEKGVLLTLDRPLEDEAPGFAVPAGGIKTHMFALSRDGERAFVTGLLSNTASLVRPRDASVAPVVVTTGRMPEGCCLSPDEGTLYVGNRRSGTLAAIDTATMRVRDTREVGGDPLRVYPLPDGRLLMIDLARSALVLLRADMREIWRLDLGAKPNAASLHPSQARAFVSLASDEVAVVDLDRPAIEGRMATGRGADVTRLLQT